MGHCQAKEPISRSQFKNHIDKLLSGGYVHSDEVISYQASVYELGTNSSVWRLAGAMDHSRQGIYSANIVKLRLNPNLESHPSRSIISRY